MSYSISKDDLKSFERDFDNTKEAPVLERAVTKNGLQAASFDWHSIADNDQTFSIDLKTGHVADQKRSGRCWMFAALNTMRHQMQEKYNLPDDFELSQSYMFFWDKFEKANYFYENVLKTAKKKVGSRRFNFLMATPQQDGGQWDMLCALIDKYGVVPQSAMPETYDSDHSDHLNDILNRKLRHDAIILRHMANEGASDDQITDERRSMLNDVYRMLAYSFGVPPKHFDFEYREKKNHKFHRDAGLSPKKFFKKYVGWNLDDYVSIINAPTKDKPFYKTYTIDMLGNVVGGRQVKHLNLPMPEFKQAAIDQLKAGESVWFGSDVVKSSETRKGIMSLEAYHEAELLDTDLNMTKDQMLDYGESMMDHAMVLTGVDLVNDLPTKWKVENSWGDSVGKKGYFVMSDSWMDQYCYQVVVNKKYLPKKLQKAQEQEPIVLKPWDPMGALA